MQRNADELTQKPVGRLLLAYSVPSVISMVVASLYGIVDTIYIGNIPDVGGDAISGVAATIPVTSLVSAFSGLVGTGMTANISLMLGRGKRDDAQQILGSGITLAVLMSLLISAAGIIFCEPLLRLFGTSATLMPYARRYITIILAGTVFNVVGQCVNVTIRADGSPVTASASTLISCVLNIALDPLFIYAFGMGIEGAAIATVISQAVTFCWVLWYYVSGRSRMKLLLRNLRLRAQRVGEIVSIGVSQFLLMASASITQALYVRFLMEHGGDSAVGSYAVVGSVSSFVLMLVFGVNQGMQPIIGYNFGAGLYSRVKKVFLIGLGAATAYLAVCAALVGIFPQAIASLFNSDAALTGFSVTGMRMAALSMVLWGITNMGRSLFISIGRRKISFMLAILRQFVLMIPTVLIMASIFKLNGVYMTQPVCDGIYAIIITALVLKEYRALPTEDAAPPAKTT